MTVYQIWWLFSATASCTPSSLVRSQPRRAASQLSQPAWSAAVQAPEGAMKDSESSTSLTSTADSSMMPQCDPLPPFEPGSTCAKFICGCMPVRGSKKKTRTSSAARAANVRLPDQR